MYLLLQWGHGILAMERPSAKEAVRTRDLLQWSHGILAMESNLSILGVPLGSTASMEPWHFSHGEQ